MTVDEHAPVIRRRHPSWWISGVIVAAVAVWSHLQPRHQPATRLGGVRPVPGGSPDPAGTFRSPCSSPRLSMLFAVTIGFLMATLAQSSNPIWRGLAKGYIGFFRGLPLLVLLLFTFNLALFIPSFGITIPGCSTSRSVPTT